jgi:hypothetical protein
MLLRQRSATAYLHQHQFHRVGDQQFPSRYLGLKIIFSVVQMLWNTNIPSLVGLSAPSPMLGTTAASCPIAARTRHFLLCIPNPLTLNA